MPQPDEPGQDGVLDLDQVQHLYDRLARLYGVATAPYRLLGGYRLVDRAIEQLSLRPGDTVVELGTGTGYALPQLSAAVGPSGRVLAVDISSRMLDRARRRVRHERLRNVELREADLTAQQLPGGTTAVLSAFATEMVPDYDAVIGRLASELPSGGRLAVTGLRDPQGWPEWAVRLGSWINRPFGVSTAYRDHRPWEAVRAHLHEVTYAEALGGVVYLSVGVAPES